MAGNPADINWVQCVVYTKHLIDQMEITNENQAF